MLKTRIAVLVSGGGTNLQALINAQEAGKLPDGEIVLVVSNVDGAYALERARQADIPAVVITKASCGHDKKLFEQRLMETLAANRIELIVLAGFMYILGENFTSAYEGRIINIHPSLIPAFCGKGYYGLKVHEAALAAGVRVTGATVHYVNHIPDGGRIIAQKAVKVGPRDTPVTLQKKVMEQAEWKLLPRAVQLVAHRLVMQKKRRGTKKS